MLFLRHFCRLICFWYFSTFYLENLPDTREPTPSACVFFFFFLACQFPVCVFNMFCCILTSFFRCSHSAVPALNTRPDSVRLWQLPLKTLENLKWCHSFSRRWISQRYRCLFFPFSAPFYLTSYAEALSPLKSTEHLLRMYLKLLKILSVAILLSLRLPHQEPSVFNGRSQLGIAALTWIHNSGSISRRGGYVTSKGESLRFKNSPSEVSGGGLSENTHTVNTFSLSLPLSYSRHVSHTSKVLPNCESINSIWECVCGDLCVSCCVCVCVCWPFLAQSDASWTDMKLIGQSLANCSVNHFPLWRGFQSTCVWARVSLCVCVCVWCERLCLYFLTTYCIFLCRRCFCGQLAYLHAVPSCCPSPSW